MFMGVHDDGHAWLQTLALLGGGEGFPIQSSTWHSRPEHYCSTSMIASPSHMHAYNIKVWFMAYETMGNSAVNK